jgi:hypothetical protein
LSEKIFCTIPPAQRPPQKHKLRGFCHRANGQTIHITEIYDFEIQIRKKTITHLIHIIQNLYNENILGIDLYAHKLSYCPEKQSFSWGLPAQWTSGHAKVHQVTLLDPLSVTFIAVNLVIDVDLFPGAPPTNVHEV